MSLAGGLFGFLNVLLFNIASSVVPQISLCRRMQGSNPGMLRLWHQQSKALTTGLYIYIIHNTRQDRIMSLSRALQCAKLFLHLLSTFHERPCFSFVCNYGAWGLEDFPSRLCHASISRSFPMIFSEQMSLSLQEPDKAFVIQGSADLIYV